MPNWKKTEEWPWEDRAARSLHFFGYVPMLPRLPGSGGSGSTVATGKMEMACLQYIVKMKTYAHQAGDPEGPAGRCVFVVPRWRPPEDAN